jgi:SAM-dependent methyltransferase
MADQTTSVEPRADAPDPPAYGASYFRNYWGGGAPYERNERWLGFFAGVADGIVRDLHPLSVLDAGCAMGFLVEALDQRGVEAWGVDVSEYAISQVDDSVRERCSVASLTEPLPRRYDLVTCIEVIEHLPAAEADRALGNLCQATDRILLSSTPDAYGEPSHLNVQPPEAWSAALAAHGFYRELTRDFSYVSPWAALYTRRELSPVELVRDYDRSWSRLRQEVGEVRAALLETQGRLAELEAQPEEEDSSQLRAEIDRREEEILRLRDLLIGKDAELGSARGQLSVLQDHSQRLNNAAMRIQSRIPGATRIGGALRRRLKSRAG